MAVRRLIATLLLLPVLAACSDDEPGSSGSGDPTTPASSDPTPTEPPPPTEPPEAREKTEAGAKAFVEYWVASLNFAARTGDTSSLHSLSTRMCNSCSEIKRLIDSTYEGGGSIESDGWQVVRWHSVKQFGPKAVIEADIRFPKEKLIREEGAEPEVRPGGTEGATFVLHETSQGWALTQFGQGY